MGLLDSVLSAGAVALGQNPGQGSPSQNGLLPILVDLLSKNGSVGGLPGLVERFEHAGLAPIIQSWISNSAAKLSITGDQIQQVLGSPMVQDIAARIGIDVGQLLPQLSQFLPVAVDRLTPEGQISGTGANSASELLALFGHAIRG